MKHLSIALAALGVAALPAPASAIVNLPVASNAYITVAGLDWAWANPCDAYGGCGDIDLTYQATQGWRLPTPAEFALKPLASAFLFRGGNVPQGGVDPLSLSRFGGGGDTPVDVGSDGACAAAYFGAVWRHCDYGDGVAGIIYDPSGNNPGYSETWLVRSAVVPEPASWALMIVGFGLVGAAMRRRVALHAA